MELLDRVNQDAVVAAWLSAEINSSRVAPAIRKILLRDRQDSAVIEQPDLGSPVENAYRLKVLGEYRGFGQPASGGANWLAGREVAELEWRRVRLSRTELPQIQFTNGDFWNEESDGTRLPTVHVQRLLADPDRAEDDLPNLVYASVRAGSHLPPMILIDAGPGSRLVVLEGHVRLIAYVMAGAAAPDQIVALLGRSPRVASWPEY